MIGNWLGVLLSTLRQVCVGGGTDAGADFVPGSKGHGL